MIQKIMIALSFFHAADILWMSVELIGGLLYVYDMLISVYGRKGGNQCACELL